MTSAFSPRSSAHPRSRGEHRLAGQTLFNPRGSSPLTRGAPDTSIDAGELAGLIPAHAGSTPASGFNKATHAAHPRSRGEHQKSMPSRSMKPGSSPLTRGAQSKSRRLKAEGRLIPAHAGSTVCQGFRNPPPTGSSPLTRGAHRQALGSSHAERLIPAHAGSTESGNDRYRAL